MGLGSQFRIHSLRAKFTAKSSRDKMPAERTGVALCERERHSHKVIVALTVKDILDEQIAKKLV